MPKYQELLIEKAALDAELSRVWQEERKQAILEFREKMRTYRITFDQVMGTAGDRKFDARSTVAPKYRDPDSGATWPGRGRAPRWIRDVADRTCFLIR